MGEDSSPPCSDTTCTKFKDFFSTHGFKHYIIFPTRLNSYLDLLLANDSSILGSVSCCPPIGSSDHVSIKFALSITYEHNFLSVTRNFAKGVHVAFRSYLAQIDWLGSFPCFNNIDEIYDIFLAILHVIDLFSHFPSHLLLLRRLSFRIT